MPEPLTHHSRAAAPASDPHPPRDTVTLDAVSTYRLDRIISMVQHGFDAPIALVRVGTASQMDVIAGVGIEAFEENAGSFCEYVVKQDETLIVGDATQDERFRHFGCVAGPPGVRFYAGTPLKLEGGRSFGALCIVDTQVRAFGRAEQQQLERYAALAADELDEHGALLEREGPLSSISDVFFALDSADQFVYMNPPAEQLLGCTQAEAHGERVWSLLPESLQGVFNAHYHAAAAAQGSQVFDVYHAAEEVWYRVSIYPYESGASVCMSNVTEAKRAEIRRDGHMHVLEMVAGGASLARSLQAVAETLERQSRAGRVMAIMTDPSDTELEFNLSPSLPSSFENAFRAVLGDGRATPYGAAVRQQRPIYVRDVMEEMRWPYFRAVCLQHGMRSCWIVPVMSEGVVAGVLAVHSEQPAAPSKDEQQGMEASADLAGIAFERCRHSERLHDNREEFRLLAEHAADVVTRHAPDSTYRYVSPSIHALLGYERDDLIGKRAFDLIHRDDVSQLVVAHRMARSYEPVQIAHRMLHRDGHYIWVESTSRVVRDPDTGQTTEIFAITRDISDRIRTEEALRRSARRLEILNNVGRTILKASSMQKVGRTVLQHLRDVIAYDYACVLEYDEADREAIIVASDADAEAVHEPGTRFPYEWTEHAYQWPVQETQYIIDLKGQSSLSALHQDMAARDMRSCLVVPAVVEGKAVGALNFGSREASSYTAMDLAVAREVASMLAVAIQQEHYRQHLVAAKEKAEEMSRLKSSFLANMSHEIRTPLTSIIGFADVLGEEVEGEARYVAQVIHRSGQRLKETISSVLELARLESESVSMRLERVSIVNEVNEAVEFMQPQAAERGITLVADCPAEPVTAMLDRAAVYRVLVNLISNAIKFTEQGQVRVRIVPGAEKVTINVEDTGIGISEQFLPQIFGEFAQETDAGQGRGEGSGLGLTITRRLVELMQGRIEVSSTKGEGTTFKVHFPVVEPIQAPVAAHG